MERVPVCSCVMVTGLNEKTTDDTIQLYFENTRRSGGNIVKHVERKTKDSAIVYFGDPKSKAAFIYISVLIIAAELLNPRTYKEGRGLGWIPPLEGFFYQHLPFPIAVSLTNFGYNRLPWLREMTP